MKIIIASQNKGKIKEFKSLFGTKTVIPYTDILDDFDIEETGKTFQENAILKSKAVYNALKINEEYIVIADDSGISVPALNNEPNIYSARYSGVNATDNENNLKLIAKLSAKKLSKTEAFYTACIAMMYKNEIYTVHGWMYGSVINEQRGDGGFGYDSMFIPNNNTKTLGELPFEVKKAFSHRTKALDLALKVMKVIN